MADPHEQQPPGSATVGDRLREAREELEAKLLRLEEDVREQRLSSAAAAAGDQLTAGDIERLLAASSSGGGEPGVGSGGGSALEAQLAKRRALDAPIADGGSADDPFAGIQKENAELSARLLETRAELAQERARADAATQELVRLQLERDVGLRQLVGGPQDQQQTEGPYPARQHLSVRDLVVENTSLRAAATSLEQRLLEAKLELALTQEELDRRTL